MSNMRDKSTQVDETDFYETELTAHVSQSQNEQIQSQPQQLTLNSLVNKAQDVGKKTVTKLSEYKDTVINGVKNPTETYHTVVTTSKQVLSSACGFMSQKLDMFKKSLVTKEEPVKSANK